MRFGPVRMVDYTETVFGVRNRRILYMPSERALKILSFGSNIRCIGACAGVRQHI